MQKVGEALKSAGVAYLEISGNAKQKAAALEEYQKVNGPRVLMLNLADESASGANLTVANHVIFLSPLLTDSQEWYDASETQAIGRVKRYGQREHVHIWRFLSKNTIDTQIYQERTGNTI